MSETFRVIRYWRIDSRPQDGPSKAKGLDWAQAHLQTNGHSAPDVLIDFIEKYLGLGTNNFPGNHDVVGYFHSKEKGLVWVWWRPATPDGRSECRALEMSLNQFRQNGANVYKILGITEDPNAPSKGSGGAWPDYLAIAAHKFLQRGEVDLDAYTRYFSLYPGHLGSPPNAIVEYSYRPGDPKVSDPVASSEVRCKALSDEVMRKIEQEAIQNWIERQAAGPRQLLPVVMEAAPAPTAALSPNPTPPRPAPSQPHIKSAGGEVDGIKRVEEQINSVQEQLRKVTEQIAGFKAIELETRIRALEERPPQGQPPAVPPTPPPVDSAKGIEDRINSLEEQLRKVIEQTAGLKAIELETRIRALEKRPPPERPPAPPQAPPLLEPPPIDSHWFKALEARLNALEKRVAGERASSPPPVPIKYVFLLVVLFLVAAVGGKTYVDRTVIPEATNLVSRLNGLEQSVGKLGDSMDGLKQQISETNVAIAASISNHGQRLDGMATISQLSLSTQQVSQSFDARLQNIANSNMSKDELERQFKSISETLGRHEKAIETLNVFSETNRNVAPPTNSSAATVQNDRGKMGEGKRRKDTPPPRPE